MGSADSCKINSSSPPAGTSRVRMPSLAVALPGEVGLYHGGSGHVLKSSVTRLGRVLVVALGVTSGRDVGVAAACVALGASVATGRGAVAVAEGGAATFVRIGSTVREASLDDVGSPQAAVARATAANNTIGPAHRCAAFMRNVALLP